MKINGFTTVIVRDRDGKVLSRKRLPLRSFLRAYNHLLCVQTRFETTPSPAIRTNDTGGTLRSLSPGSDWRCNAGVGTTLYGIRVGTDNTAVDIAQYALIAAIAEGAGGGQMNHLVTSFNFIGVVGGQCSFEIERVIENNSGGAIGVEEVGIYSRANTVGDTNRYFCIARDLHSEAVPDEGSITVTYTIRVVA
ncbi:hypothetical protein ES703_47508 [subsurface metagenome]